jgi:hypothetical protein
MVEIPRDHEHEHMGKGPRKGMWCVWATYRVMGCPECGRPNKLDAYAVAPDGLLTPSVVCSHRPYCGFHGTDVRLLDWRS